MSSGTLTGTRVLLRSFVRRDRWMILAWVVAITMTYLTQAIGVDGLYATQAELDRAAAAMGANPAFVAMAGPPRALDTVGGQVAWQSAAFGAVLAGLMSMFLVGRHTRAEEESGRDELLRSLPVGRHATPTAALLVAVLANTGVGVGVAGSLLAYGLPVPGSLALGVGQGLVGLLFTGVVLVSVQLTQGVRSAYGITGAVLGVAYVLRAVGDLGDGTASWLSPIGWFQAMRAFSGERWWPAMLLGAGIASSLIAAYVLIGRRDLGAGLLAARPGPARGRVHGPLGLAWRLQRASVLGWSLGLLLTGLAYGAIGNDVGQLLGDSAATNEVLVRGGGSITDGFYSAALLMIALLASGFAVSSALRARGEERAGRLEPLLATPLSRKRWLLAQVAVGVAGSTVVVALGGLGTGIGFALVTGDGSAVGPFLADGINYLPPVLVLMGLTVLLHGVSIRACRGAWLALGFCVVVLVSGPVLRFPGWLSDASPFSHPAAVPAQAFAVAPVLVLVLVAVTMTAVGTWAFGRRDLG